MSVTVSTERHEGVNMSNTNFSTLWAALGLHNDDDWCGSIEPDQLLVAIAIADPLLAVRPTQRYGDADACHVIDFGIDENRVIARMEQLKEIALFAKENGTKVEWC